MCSSDVILAIQRMCTLAVTQHVNIRSEPGPGFAFSFQSISDVSLLTLSTSTMLQWTRTLPRSRLSSLSSTRLLPQSRHVSSSPLLRPSPFSRLSFSRPIIWLLPVVGGVTIYFYPRTHPLLSPPISSKTCLSDPNKSLTLSESLIFSPSELHLSLSERIYTLFLDHIWEPILTARRFIHLFFLFAPVIISSPMLLVGSPEQRWQGDRWGAVWWYDYLVAQMDRAGPTFIKVRVFVSCLSFCIRLTRHSSAACSMGSLARRSISLLVV